MNRLFILLFWVAFAMSARSEEAILHSGIIAVEFGSVKSIVDAIKAYESHTRKTIPQSVAVEIYELEQGFLVYFPDGITTYEFTNLVGWLNEPVGYEFVNTAAGWLQKAQSGKFFYLVPETSNPWGDSLLGVSEDGVLIRAYLPDGTISVNSSDIRFSSPPVLPETAQADITLQIDADTSFGNHKFEISK